LPKPKIFEGKLMGWYLYSNLAEWPFEM